MKILIPTILSTNQKVGVTQYLIGLIRYLQKVDSSNEYFIITSTDNFNFFDFDSKNFHEIRITIREKNRLQLRFRYFIWHSFSLPKLIKKNQIDLVHEPCVWFTSKKIKTVVTIHDLIELKTTKYSSLLNFIKRKMIASSIINSSKIIAVSNSTRSDIINIFTKESELIYNGVNQNEVIISCKEEVLIKFRVTEKKYFIFVGTIQRHKNLSNLIEAFSRFLKDNGDYKLILVGKPDNAQLEVEDKIDKFKLKDRIIITGHLPETEKIVLIKNSKALLLVSNYEGFGFPVLEAQSLGIPVIVSNNSSLPEIGGEAALLVDQKNPVDIANKMQQLFEDHKLYTSLINKGLINIKRFSWEECARKTLAAYISTLDKD